MEGKDFKTIYENFYNEYLDQYIKEVEELYKKINKEGDAENYAYNSCLSFLTNKTVNLKIKSAPFINFYSVFKNRYSLVQNNNLDRLYIKHIIPLSDKLNIEMNEKLYENLLNEFAISVASIQIYSWFCNSSSLYKMMFELNDFSEFKLIRNCDYLEGQELFKKYQKKLYPRRYLLEKGENIKINTKKSKSFNFQIKKEKKLNITFLYHQFSSRFINKDLTRLVDFENVLFENWDTHSSKIYFKEYFETQQIAYLFKKLEKHFLNLNQATIGRSLLFYTKSDKREYLVLTRANLASSYKSMNEKSMSFTPSNKVKIKYLDGILTKAQLN